MDKVELRASSGCFVQYHANYPRCKRLVQLEVCHSPCALLSPIIMQRSLCPPCRGILCHPCVSPCLRVYRSMTHTPPGDAERREAEGHDVEARPVGTCAGGGGGRPPAGAARGPSRPLGPTLRPGPPGPCRPAVTLGFSARLPPAAARAPAC